jgi:hypothetical protein
MLKINDLERSQRAGNPAHPLCLHVISFSSAFFATTR